MRTRPVIAIVGRPNVGKSTLFNRLVGRRLAIVEDTPGVTRDRHFKDCDYEDRPVSFVDTGGFVPDADEDVLAKHIRMQAQAAVEEADIVLFVVDGRVGISGGDADVARYLRKHKRPLILVVNKVDGRRDKELLTSDFFSLALGEPVPVSAEHNIGFDVLCDRLLELLPPAPAYVEPLVTPQKGDLVKLPKGPDKNTPIRVALVGRPNVGKSTLVNALLGEDRVIVSPIAGTTRDPIDTDLVYGGRKVTLTDTAGIRRKSAISQKVEEFSVFGAIRAIEDSDVAVLVLDATEAGVDQDQKIASIAEEKGRALLIVVNKWDLVRGTAKEEHYRDSLKWYMKFVSWAPMVFISAKDGHRVSKVLEVALQLFDMQHFRAGTPMLNKIVEHVTTEHALPVVHGKPLKLYYAMQVATAPPSFAFIANNPKDIPDRYVRYVTNYLRETFNLKVPIRMFWRERPGAKQRAAKGVQFKNRSESIRKAKNRKR
jgi:GTP-binding protein